MRCRSWPGRWAQRSPSVPDPRPPDLLERHPVGLLGITQVQPRAAGRPAARLRSAGLDRASVTRRALPQAGGPRGASTHHPHPDQLQAPPVQGAYRDHRRGCVHRTWLAVPGVLVGVVGPDSASLGRRTGRDPHPQRAGGHGLSRRRRGRKRHLPRRRLPRRWPQAPDGSVIDGRVGERINVGSVKVLPNVLEDAALAAGVDAPPAPCRTPSARTSAGWPPMRQGNRLDRAPGLLRPLGPAPAALPLPGPAIRTAPPARSSARCAAAGRAVLEADG